LQVAHHKSAERRIAMATPCTTLFLAGYITDLIEDLKPATNVTVVEVVARNRLPAFALVEKSPRTKFLLIFDT